MRVFLNKEGRQKILEGITLSVNCIKKTLGGAGRNVVIYSGGLVYSTADGVSIARSVVLEGDLNIGAQVIRNSTEQQLQDCGDATSCCAVLTQKIIEYGFAAMDEDIADSSEIKKGLDKGIEIVCNEIDKMAIQVGDDNEKIKNIATISARNDSELGEMIAGAFKEIGNDGILFIEESKSYKTFVSIQKGFSIDRGYISPLFANQETMEVELIRPLILLYDGKIEKMDKLIPVLTEMKNKGMNMQILIICDNVEGEALKTLIVNRMKGAINVVCVNAPHFGERKIHSMSDIATITGAEFITPDKGINDFDLKYWGTCDKAVITKNSCTIIGGNGDKDEVEKASKQIDALLGQAETEIEKIFLKQRKAKLTSKMAVISVGAQTEQEMREKKDRTDDAVKSTESAISEGIVIGGGVALARCVAALENVKGISDKQMVGIEILKKSLTAPISQILENAGVENKEEIIASILKMEPEFGFNVKTGKIENLMESGVIDAAKVCKYAVKNAGSVAGTILMSEALIC